MNATVSVVIPTYNRAHLIRRAIESILAQTAPGIEIIVVDDGSRDNTADVIAEYGSRARYLRQENAGVGAARNAGIRLCTGRYVAFLDSDDYWLDFKIELQCRLLEAIPEAAFTFSEFMVEKDDGSRRHDGSRQWLAEPIDWAEMYGRTLRWRDWNVQVAGAPADFPVYVGSMYRHFLRSAFVLPTTAMVRRDALEPSIRFTERVAIFEDWEFFARLSRRHPAVFADVETAINSGHSGPERVTRCSQLSKAESYLRMVRSVWKSDAEFLRASSEVVQRAEERALLAIAREALLDGRADVAGSALDQWRQLPNMGARRSASGSASRALMYTIAASWPAGARLFKLAFLGSKLVRSILAPSAHVSYPVNPAA